VAELATNPETEVETEETAPETDETEAEPGEDIEAAEQPGDETEEVEHERKKYKIPKPLKGALLMQADYPRKTQEVAEQRKALEERSKSIADEQKSHSEHLTEIARVVAYNDAIAQFEKADWPSIRANNPAMYDQLWFQYQQTKEARDKAVIALQGKVQERTSKAQQGNCHAPGTGPRSNQARYSGVVPRACGKAERVCDGARLHSG
jgi:hypothetical protein